MIKPNDIQQRLLLPVAREIGTQKKDGIDGEVFIVDATGERLFKGEGLSWEGSIAAHMVTAVNAFPKLVEALLLVRSAHYRPDIDPTVVEALEAAGISVK